jgi:hypothetical protein
VSPRALAAICIAALALGTATAMVVTQRLRSEGPVAVNIRMKTKPDERYRACLQPTRDDRFTLAMVDSEERVVRVLVTEEPLVDEEPRCFDWDGVGDDGAPVPAGVYRLRLTLHDADREVISGERLTIPAPVDEGGGA